MCVKFYKILLFFCMFVFCVGCGAPEMVLVGEGDADASGQADMPSLACESGGEEVTSATGQDGGAEIAAPKYIQVYVCGAVMHPGLYTVLKDSRVAVALEAAGGFTPDAGRDSVNLADWLTDGQMVYFPTLEEEQQQKAQVATGQKGMVNINTASVDVLSTLPGIGESKAADIISYRETNGRFRQPEDIMKVPGIKENLYAKIRERIVVE